jgi:hypothetical protein
VSVFDAHEVLQALINLNQWEDELKTLGPRTARRAELDLSVTAERPKVAPFILAHHDRIRARGRCSTAPVRDWICRSCFISLPIGIRTKLSHRDDICVCENCGAYIYLPTPEQQTTLEAADARKRQVLLDRANKVAKATAAASPPPPPPPAKKATPLKTVTKPKTPTKSKAETPQSSRAVKPARPSTKAKPPKSTASKAKAPSRPAAKKKKPAPARSPKRKR